MNKFSKIAALVFCMAAAASAQLKGLGYDVSPAFPTNPSVPGEITARLGLGANNLDLGVGFAFNNSDLLNDDQKLVMTASAYFLAHLHDWGAFDNYLAAGLLFAKDGTPEDNIHLGAFVGMQPEVTLMDHIVLSIRFGLNIPVMPDFKVHTKGNPISVVEGASFKVLF